MKRICILLIAGSLCALPAARAQDAATQQRLDELSGKIETLTAGQENLRKQIAELSHEVDALREQAAKPQPTYASPDDLKRVSDAVEEESRKRIGDYDKIHAELENLGNLVKNTPVPAPSPKMHATPPAAKDNPPQRDQKGYEYKVKSGDTLLTIIQGCAEQNVKVKLSDVLKANPGMNPEKIKVGDTIFIPAPKP
jgi:hypothetical protein